MDETDLQRFIDENQIEAKIVYLDDRTPTVESAAAVLGVEPVQIVKSLLFLIKEEEDSYRPYLVVTNGLSRVSYKKLADHLSVSRRRVRIASMDQVRQATGYPVGAVPPFGHRQRLATLLDRSVLSEEEIYAGGGALNALVHLSVDELQRVLDAEVADVGE